MNKSEKILVADSEIQILHVISLKLREAGYQVFATQNGLEALDWAQVEKPDLVITACRISGLSGLELCQRLKSLPGTCGIPTVLLTSRGYSLDESRVQAAGINQCLNKGVLVNTR